MTPKSGSPARLRVCLDTCIVLDALAKREGAIEEIRPIIRDAEQGKLLLVVSMIALPESFFIRNSSESAADQVRQIRAFLQRTCFHLRAVDWPVGVIAQEICQAHKTSAPDGTHLATAIATKCVAFVTDDGKRKDGFTPPLALDRKLGGTPKLHICTAKQFNLVSMPLFAQAAGESQTA